MVLAKTGEQAHHINQFKAFEGFIEYGEGICVQMEGSVLKSGTIHNLWHKSMERFYALYRAGGPKDGLQPTIKEYNAAAQRAYEEAGLLAEEAEAIVDLGKAQQVFFGLLEHMFLPNVPKKTNIP